KPMKWETQMLRMRIFITMTFTAKRAAVLIAIMLGVFGVMPSTHAVTIFSDFGPGNTFNVGVGWTVQGFAGFPQFTPVMGFSSPVEADVTQIDIALSRISGTTNAATINLFTNVGGALGTLLGSWSVGNFPQFGSAGPVTTISAISGVHLNAGGLYFLEATDENLADSPHGAWNFKSVGVTGEVLLAAGIPELLENQTLGAFDVIGDVTAAPTTPMPPALPLFATGLGMMGLLAWRRKRK